VGRLLSAGLADHLGLSANFAIFAALNLTGATLAFFALRRTSPVAKAETAQPSWSAMFAKPELRSAFSIGFLILFVFIGTFTYVNFVLTGGPIGLGAMQLGFVYFVFVPAIILTPFAGKVARKVGAKLTIAAALGVAGVALPLLIVPELAAVLVGLAIVGAGTFFAQAAATGYVSRAAGANRGAAGGVYLASYYSGGLVGSLLLGQIFDRFGWPATVLALALALSAGVVLAFSLKEAQ
jgi:YNFM family putative membrane transporter